jgi:hypothetical protein
MDSLEGAYFYELVNGAAMGAERLPNTPPAALVSLFRLEKSSLIRLSESEREIQNVEMVDVPANLTLPPNHLVSRQMSRICMLTKRP